MKSYTKIVCLAVVFFVFGLTFVFQSAREAQAQTEQEKLEELKKQIEEYEQEVTKLKNQANTLSNQIAQYDAQIRLTTLKISQTVEKIDQLGFRIDALETSIDSLTEAFASRAVKTYKMSRLQEPYLLLVSADDLQKAVSSYHYLQKIQEADRDLLTRLASAQDKYEVEKDEQESLQEELESQKATLDAQKAAKDTLLAATKNDEKKYQQLLSSARAEYDAIQALIAGKGDETEVGPVNQGDRVASIISGSSPCSNGTHLHLEVTKDNVRQNPASYLSQKDVIWDNSPDSPFSFTGNWPWPLNDPIRVTQGYGMTHFAAVLHYYNGNPHTGIDMVNVDSLTVHAVQSGKLFQGSIPCGGRSLKYVRVEQSDNINTYYLHVNY